VKHAAKEIEPYSAPQLIHNYDRETGRGPLHIADKCCRHNSSRKDITRCGRIMSPDWRGFRSTETLEKFRLCKRCGTAEEFAQAVAKHDEWWRQRNEQERIRREKENAEREAVWAEKVKHVHAFASFLIDKGLRVGVSNGTATVERDGYEFTLTATGPIQAAVSE
jgi:hypothetical protein